MKAEFDREQLLRLVDRLTVGTITPAEHDRLEELLKGSTEARKTYFAYLDVDLGLREIALGSSPEIPPPVGLLEPIAAGPGVEAPRDRRGLRGYVLVAAVTALTTAIVFWLSYPQSQPWTDAPVVRSPATNANGEPTAEVSANEYVATLLFADECRWDDDVSHPVEGQRLAIGQLRLLEGMALMRFDGGAVAVLSGDALVDLESRGSVRLSYGNLSIRAPEEAIGFTVRTPASDVVDLGTEFAVEVRRSGATEIHVLDGMVEFRDPAKHVGSGQLLKGGQAVRIDKAKAAQPTPVPFHAKPIEQMLREAKPKPREDLLVVYEGFQHDAGTLPLVDADGGWGWWGPWRRRRNGERDAREPQSPREMQIAFQKLRVPWPIRGGRAGMLEMAPGNEYLIRPLQEPVDLARDRVYFLSMMIREDLDAKATTTPKRDESARLTLRSSEDYWGDRVCFGLPQHRKPHIEVADFIRFTGPEVSGGQTMIWVAKIAAQRRGEDEIFFRVYQEGESLDIFELADWSIVSRGVKSDAKLDLLLLSSTGETRRWFDEIRIGTSWRAVIPIAQRTKLVSDQSSQKMKEREH
jgi:hypothetical protein